MNLWKKTLLATAVAAISTGAMAVNVTSTKVVHTEEGIKSATVVNAADVVATLGAEYKADDIIKFVFTKPLDSSFTPAPTINANVSGATAITAMTLGFVSSTENTLTYRVTTLTTSATPNSTIGATVTLTGTKFVASDLRSAKQINVTYSAETSGGTAIDAPGTGQSATAAIVGLDTQYSLALNPVFNGVIDVEQDRKKFVNEENSGKNDDSLTFTLTDAADGAPAAGTQWGDLATAEKVDVTVKGSFAFLDTDPDTDGIQLGNNTVSIVGGTGSIVDADIKADSLTVKGIDASAASKLVIEILEDTVIPSQAFTADYTLKFKDAASTDQTAQTNGVSAGNWDLNGSSTDIRYVPYGSNLEQFIWVTNKGAQSGAITVTAFDESGNTYGPYDLGMSEAGTIKRLSADIAEKLAADGFTSGRVAMNVTVNVPKADASVYAAYKVSSDADRLTLPTDKL